MAATTSPVTLPPDAARGTRRRRGSRVAVRAAHPVGPDLLLAAGYPLGRQLVMSLQEYGWPSSSASPQSGSASTTTSSW